MAEVVIKYENVKKSYEGNVVISNFNLEIEEGAFVTIIGSSGCGKTTVLKMINGLVGIDEGTIYVYGKDISKENLVELRRNIGYAIQGSSLFPHMTVAQNIAYVPNLFNKSDKGRTRCAVSKWMQVVGLGEDLLVRYPDELSGGQQQRVGIARALAASPEILLMDEPFGAVDEITRQQLQDEMLRIHDKHNVTIVFITHDIKEALKLGSKVLVMDKGQAVQYDRPEMIKEKPASEFVAQLTGSK